MKWLVSVPVGIMTVLLVSATLVQAHCEVPCGIYDDQRRFEQMLEDQTAIAKAMTEINKLAGKDDALSRNQFVRWVNTKESHAVNIQHIVSQYFLAQRIKPGKDDAGRKAYVRNLIAAHAVIQKAMKCKQTVDPANADLLKKAILDLHKAYEK
jgi:nickel superoxide dismutase